MARRPPSSTLFPTRRSSDLMDFMGHRPLDRGRVHPWTLLDDHSRFALGLEACADERQETVTAQLTAVFRRSEEHTSELQSQSNLVCRLLLEKKKTTQLPPLS